MRKIYSNNDVEIVCEQVDAWESKININGSNLMWISTLDADKLKEELTELFDKYRI